MKRKNIFLLALFFIGAGCSIIEDNYIDELPADIKPSKINLRYRQTNTAEYGEKSLAAKIVYSANQAVINWPQGVDFFFYNKNATKTVYQLNANGFADKITTTFTDGTIMEDVLTYNANKQVVEVTNSFFKDNLKLFYKNNALDSVVKTRTVNNVTQKGFFKRVNTTAMISIFPYDNTKPYDITLSTSTECGSGGSLPANMNMFNKTEYFNIPQDYNTGVYADYSLKINYKVNTTTNYFAKYFQDEIYGYSNYFMKPDYYSFYSSECSGGNVNNGHLNVFRLLPALVPDFLMLYQLTAENELEWIVENAAKEFPEWLISEIGYSYEPTSN